MVVVEGSTVAAEEGAAAPVTPKLEDGGAAAMAGGVAARLLPRMVRLEMCERGRACI
jgi:hypothetical protein